MLVLGRKVGEKIVIQPPGSTPIILTICKIDPNGNIRLGFEADREITIDRMEVWESKQAEALLV
jgi:carbon storage regulator CsrA